MTEHGAAVLGVVVVNYGSSALLERHLTPLQVGRDCAQVVVVDNHTTSHERATVVELGRRHGWHVVQSDDNPGFSAACNRGVARARELGCEVLLLLNPDADVAPEVLGRLADQLLDDPMALVTPRIVRPDGTDWFRGGAIDLRAGRTRTLGRLPGPTAPWLTAACLAVHRDLWERVGGLDEGYFLYWEDIDFSRRCAQAGAALVVREDLVAVHHVGGTQSGTQGTAGGKSSLYCYYNCRNRLVFAARHAAREDLRRWLVHTPSYALAVVLRGGRRAALHPGPLWAAVRGSWDGARVVLPLLARRSG